ncbi:hypothetical protein CJ030_MR1G013816 [Morella rubra]|uniref:Uncharacterized protein n=1 Tax=Morella rubra TaxID=262757 RepID=A0A6A1WT72_9ROSI|nr:hypothetical protein CJ030_MR1G013816 [Morella rubra]
MMFDDEVDDYCENEPYNFNIEQAPENVQDDMTWFRNEVEGTTLDISQDFPTRFRTISSSSQQATPSSQQSTPPSQQALPPSQQPTPSSQQATVPSFEHYEPSNDDEPLGRHRSEAGKQSRSLQHQSTLQDLRALHVMLRSWRMEEIELNDSASSQTLSQSRMGGTISWSPFDRYAQVIGPERHGRIRGVGLGPTPSSHPTNTNEQHENQNVANPNLNQVPPTISSSSHASRKTFHDNVDGEDNATGGSADGANSAGADGAGAGAKLACV